MFYGATDVETCLAELCHGPDETACTVGSFITARPFNVLDLTRLPPVPGTFSRPSPMKMKRLELRFLHAFSHDISRPVERDELIHIEYVPTQVVTEYFRRAYRTKNGEPIQGILYPSAKRSASACCVLFFENEQTWMVSPGWQDEVKKDLSGKGPFKWWLGLVPRSKRTFTLGRDMTWARAKATGKQGPRSSRDK